jgi:hypothetical protein
MCIQWIGMIARNKEQRVVKTNAVRVLDRLAIKYELREYEVDPQDLSAEAVAAKIGLPPEQLFKTLAVRGDRNGIYLAVISGNDELDFKALAHHTGDRKVEMVPLKEVQEATGHSRRSYRSGVQEGLSGIHGRASSNLRCDLSICRDKGTANLAGSRRLHPCSQS